MATVATTHAKKNKMQNNKVHKIISGGQGGADRAGLEAARKLGLQTGGSCPAGWRVEGGSGFDPTLKEFGIVCLESPKYPPRSMKNVDDSDGTLAFRLKSSPGTDYTIAYAQTKVWGSEPIIQTTNLSETKYKPVCVITQVDDEELAANEIKAFVSNNKIGILNVAGHRDGSVPIENFSGKIESIIVKALGK